MMMRSSALLMLVFAGCARPGSIRTTSATPRPRRLARTEAEQAVRTALLSFAIGPIGR
jgi:hypothetical protein